VSLPRLRPTTGTFQPTQGPEPYYTASITATLLLCLTHRRVQRCPQIRRGRCGGHPTHLLNSNNRGVQNERHGAFQKKSPFIPLTGFITNGLFNFPPKRLSLVRLRRPPRRQPKLRSTSLESIPPGLRGFLPSMSQRAPISKSIGTEAPKPRHPKCCLSALAARLNNTSTRYQPHEQTHQQNTGQRAQPLTGS